MYIARGTVHTPDLATYTYPSGNSTSMQCDRSSETSDDARLDSAVSIVLSEPKSFSNGSGFCIDGSFDRLSRMRSEIGQVNIIIANDYINYPILIADRYRIM